MKLNTIEIQPVTRPRLVNLDNKSSIVVGVKEKYITVLDSDGMRRDIKNKYIIHKDSNGRYSGFDVMV